MEGENQYFENKETANTKFNSPIPLLNKLGRIIFGEKNPEMLPKMIIYLNIIIWFIFILWHILSYSAISFREIILDVKKLNVEILILNRGSELGFDPSVFLNRLLNFHKLSILCWTAIFVGIVFMWRQKPSFKYFIGIPIVFYLALLLFYMGIDYYKEDTTLFDKIIFSLFVINTFIYYLITKSGNKTGDFFLEDEE
jgi:hypothetical protein